jgi:hypothetical protein
MFLLLLRCGLCDAPAIHDYGWAAMAAVRFPAEMRTLVFIFSAKSNRIITNNLWSTEMNQYFAVQNRNLTIFGIFMMDGILNAILQNRKQICSSIVS